MKNLGKLISITRDVQKITQTQLAEMIGVSRQYMSDIENNRRNVSVKVISDIAKCLDQNKFEALFVETYLQGLLDEHGIDLLVSISCRQ